MKIKLLSKCADLRKWKNVTNFADVLKKKNCKTYIIECLVIYIGFNCFTFFNSCLIIAHLLFCFFFLCLLCFSLETTLCTVRCHTNKVWLIDRLSRYILSSLKWYLILLLFYFGTSSNGSILVLTTRNSNKLGLIWRSIITVAITHSLVFQPSCFFSKSILLRIRFK